MRHKNAKRKFSRDHSARKSLFRGLAKNLIEREQIKTTLPKAKDLRSVVEKLITRAKVDSVANRRIAAAEIGPSHKDAVKKLFTVLGPRYANRPGGYTRVLKAGFRYGDAAPMAIIEFIDRDPSAKANPKSVKDVPKTEDKKQEKEDKADKKPVATKAKKEAAPAAKATVGTKARAPRRTVAG